MNYVEKNMKNSTATYLIEKNTNNLYIKRDDLIPYSFGGNKARKAYYFIDEIDRNNNDCVVTYGSSSSNHCRVIANICAKRNIPCYIISSVDTSKDTYNKKMMKLFDAKIISVSIDKVHEVIEEKINELKNNGKNPYFIPGGGHGNIGTKAYVKCYDEIKEYEKENNIFFDYIFLASGTGTTQAGLVCGKYLNKDNRDIIGISIARKNPRGKNIVLESICEYLDSNNIVYDKNEIDKITVFEDSYIGDGYGQNNEEIKKIIKKSLIQYGIPLDSTYTGKAFYGMQKYLEKNNIKNKNILFLHTGGTPLFFDDLEMM